MPTLRRRTLRLSSIYRVLLVIGALAGCDTGQPMGPQGEAGDDADDDNVKIGTHEAALTDDFLTGRTVEIQVPGTGTTMTPTQRAVGFLQSFDCPVTSVAPAGLTAAQQTCANTVAALATEVCTGQRAMMVANSLRTVEVGDLMSGTTVTGTFVSEDPDKDYPGQTRTLRYTVLPGKASDRASWALLAASRFRRAVSDYLTPIFSQCLNWDATVAGRTISASEFHASLLVDAVAGAEEAVQASSALIASAASQPGRTVEENWRGRFDSKLEAASALLSIPLMRYQAVPLWLYRRTDGIGYYAAPYAIPPTQTETLPSTHILDSVGNPVRLGWIYPPTATAPSGTTPLYLNRATGVVTTSPGTDTMATGLRLLGWFPASTGTADSTDELFECTGTQNGLADKTLTSAALGCPIGYARCAGTGCLPAGFSVFRTPPARSTLRESWPLASSSLGSPSEQKAADLLNAWSINPNQDGASMAADLFTVLNAEYGGAFTPAGGSAGLLTKLGLTTQDLTEAAGRSLSSAAAFGRELVRVPSAASGPARYVLSGDPRAPADPAYLFALAAGSSEFLYQANPQNSAVPADGVAYALSVFAVRAQHSASPAVPASV